MTNKSRSGNGGCVNFWSCVKLCGAEIAGRSVVAGNVSQLVAQLQLPVGSVIARAVLLLSIRLRRYSVSGSDGAVLLVQLQPLACAFRPAVLLIAVCAQESEEPESKKAESDSDS